MVGLNRKELDYYTDKMDFFLMGNITDLECVVSKMKKRNEENVFSHKKIMENYRKKDLDDLVTFVSFEYEN